MSIDLELEEGMELPPVVRSPGTRDLVRFAHGANDSAPLHYDKDYARQRGFDSVIIHGSLKGSYMAQVLTNWAGTIGWVSRFRCEYRAPDVPGSALTARGIVELVEADRDETRVSVALWLENATGAVTTRGSGVVVFPNNTASDDPQQRSSP